MFIIISGKFIDPQISPKPMSKLIVCLTGMPGAGKSTIADGLKSKGYEIINMGNAVRNEAKKLNLEPTGPNLGKLMLELREKKGPGAIAELVKPEIENSKSDVIIIDGIRSYPEIEALKNYGKVKLLAIHASTDTRFGFLQQRGRSDDPKTKENFEERDDRELNVGISNPIALSDDAISNNNLSKDELIELAFNKIKNWIK